MIAITWLIRLTLFSNLKYHEHCNLKNVLKLAENWDRWNCYIFLPSLAFVHMPRFQLEELALPANIQK